MQRGIRLASGILTIAVAASLAAAGKGELVPSSERALLDSTFFWEDIDSAIALTREVAARYPDDPYPLHDLGRLLLRTRRPELLPEAERVLLKCIALEPTEAWVTAWALVSLAEICYQTGRDTLGAEYSRRVIEMDATRNVTRMAWSLMRRNRPNDERDYSDWSLMESEHLRVHYSPVLAPHEAYVSATVRDYETAYRRLKQFWKSEPLGCLEVYFYSDDEMLTDAAKPVPHMFPERREIHATLDASPGHEMTHIFAYSINPDQRSAFLAEGIATVLDQRRTPFAIDAELTEVASADDPVSVDEMNRMFDYGDDYAFAASFVTHLIREYGVDRLLALYRSEEPLKKAAAATLGAPLSEVEASWKEHMSGMDAIVAALLEIAPVADDPEEALPIVDRVMAEYGGLPELMAYRARLLVKAGRYEEAIEAARVAVATEDDPTFALFVAREGHVHWADALAALGKPEEARAHLQEVIAIGSSDNWTDDARRKLAALDAR